MDRVWITLLAAAFIGGSRAKAPHIVILMADDMGWNDVGLHGSEISTPNIDALAYSGIVLRRHYAQPACTPSRSALLTGQYPMRYGLQGSPLNSRKKDGLPTNLTIMPQILKSLGYRTHLVGKWHQGFYSWPHMPTRRGFDSFFGYLNGYLTYYDGVHYDPPNIGLDFWHNETGAWPKAYAKYLPQLLSKRAEEVIQEHSRWHKEDPMFLLLAANAPHAGGSKPFEQEPPPKRNDDNDFIKDPERRVLADVMQYLDDTLGNLTATLKAEGMLDNTLLLFLSDNGGPSIDPVWGYGNAASNYPLRGTKMSMYEGGVRVPAIFWASSLNRTTPRTYDGLFHITDWLPTFTSAAGGASADGLDGIDQWKALMDVSTKPPRTELLVEINDVSQSWGYVRGNYKLVKSYNNNDDLAFSNYYFSPPPQTDPTGYKFEKVKSSSVAKSIGRSLDEQTVMKYREQLRVTSSCTVDNQKMAGKRDCSETGCIYDLSNDPSECFDLSSQLPVIYKELTAKIDRYRDATVQRRNAPTDNVPDSRNYFAPSQGVTLYSSWKTMIFFNTFCTVFISAVIHEIKL